MAVNKGGAMLTVEGLRAFMPGSHYLPGQTPTEELVGKVLFTAQQAGYEDIQLVAVSRASL